MSSSDSVLVLRGKASSTKTSIKTSGEKKTNAGRNIAVPAVDHQRQNKLDGNDIVPINKVDKSVSQTIAKYRGELKLSQKQFAAMINTTHSIVKDYESGNATPVPQVLSRMERVLGVTLLGKNIGEPREDKKANKVGNKGIKNADKNIDKNINENIVQDVVEDIDKNASDKIGKEVGEDIRKNASAKEGNKRNSKRKTGNEPS